MTATCRIRFPRSEYDILMRHLFPGDRDEHGAVLLAGVSDQNGEQILSVREVHLAREGVDYVKGKIGYRALEPTFIHRLITRARDERLAYIAVHNHEADRHVGFSQIDTDSHHRGYPALLQIAKGMPVGALVAGRRSMQASVWFPNGARLELDEAVVVGKTIQRIHPAPLHATSSFEFDRQVRMFGLAGQQDLRRCRVGIIGLGGVGSLVTEYLARLGVGAFLLIDPDRVEETNLSRIVGATKTDSAHGSPKVEVAKRVINNANSAAKVRTIVDDVAKESVALELSQVDYLFLAADSMRARLVFNAIVHQYLIPGVQLGSKVRADDSGSILDIIAVNRPVRPGEGCLWCNELIDPMGLAKESKTDAEREAQAYGTEQPNPSVIALNAISASHAVNDFMLDYLSLRLEPDRLRYEQFNFLRDSRSLVEPRKTIDCSECSRSGKRFGRGDQVSLPCIES